MGIYSIKDLENFTKIKAHTLRIWEQRYNLLNPKRTETNIRYYSDEDLKKILNINLLYNNGLKISKIADLPPKEIISLAEEILNDASANVPTEISKFIRNIIEFKAAEIEADLRSAEEKLGLEKMFQEIIMPVLEKIGELWQVNTISIAHEHQFSNILRAFIIEKTNLIVEMPTKEKVILFLREGEYHELALLFYNYILKKRGYECHYLGQSFPVEEFQQTAKALKPAYVFTSVTAKISQKEMLHFFDEILSVIPSANLYVGGYQACTLGNKLPKGIRLIKDFQDIDLK
jgi:methanogenic corrinoid protein MtbC1